MKKITLALLLCFAFFAKAQTIYVDINASGLNDGSSWTDAYTDLNAAIAAASSGEIWVADGTYYTGISGNNAATFTLKNNVALYGGFDGNETMLSQRNPKVFLSILSGDQDFTGTPTSNDAYHVVTAGQT